MLDKIKQVTEPTESDVKLSLYVNIAIRLIKNYLNNEKFNNDYIKKEYEDIIILIIKNALDSKNEGIRQITEGDTSIVYFDDKSFCVNDDIEALLPVPYMKMR